MRYLRLDQAIELFLAGRLADRLKKKIIPSLGLDDRKAVQDEVEAMFTLEEWLPNAAKRAAQIALVTHPSKFSHPSAKTTPVMTTKQYKVDGYLRTGNVAASLDAFGNAAAMDVYKFLTLILCDGKSVLEHLELNTDKIKEDLNIKSAEYEEIRLKLLSIKGSNESSDEYTSDKVKQVYFPVAEGYHLLSILTPSTLMYEMKARIQTMQFSDEAKAARKQKRDKKFSEVSFEEIYGLTCIGYGGTKPQNISVLNSTNGGKAYLLPSVPPIINTGRQRLPKKNFFAEILWNKDFEVYFKKIQGLISIEMNNISIRQGIDHWIRSIIDDVLKKVWAIRSHAPEWSYGKRYDDLRLDQKIWLDDARKEERHASNDWFEELSDTFARWYVSSYNKSVRGNLAKSDLDRFKAVLIECKENLL